MKKYIVTLLMAAAFINVKSASAQDAYDMMVDGVKVIVKPSGNHIVVIETFIKGGVQNYNATNAGIEGLAMSSLVECGTLKHDKNSFKDELDKVSGSINGFASKDYSGIAMSCIKGDFDTVWPLYAEVITEPKFDTAEFSRNKGDMISYIKRRESSPDAAIDMMANKTAFANRNYALDPYGTVDVVSKLTAGETKAYYHSILTKSRMLIVVVADLDRATIEKNVKGMLANIKPGSPFQMKESFFRVYNNSFKAEQRDLATNYIEGVTSGPELDAPDFYAFQLAMRIFWNRGYQEIREKHALTYTPQEYFAPGSTSSAKFEVTTTRPNDYIAVFNNLVDSTKKSGFTGTEVTNMKTKFLTSYYMGNETNASLASAIASNEILHNDWRRAMTVMNNVNKLTVDDINNAFRKYIGNIVWVYQGDPKKVNPLLYTNGTTKAGDNPVSN